MREGVTRRSGANVLRAALVGLGTLACGSHADSASSESIAVKLSIDNTRWAHAETTITPQNVGKLGVKWAFEARGPVSATPTVVDGHVYAPDWGGYLHKIDATTGTALWSIKLDESFAAGTGSPEDTEPYVTIDGEKRAVRLVSQASPTVHGSLVIVSLKRPLTTPGRVDPTVYDPVNNPKNPFGVTNPPAGAYIAAFNKNTGELKWKQVLHDFHFNHAGKYIGMSGSSATARPLVFGNRVYAAVGNETQLLRLPVGSSTSPYSDFYFRGKVVSLDIKDGSIVWSRHTISDEMYTSTGDGTRYSGGGVWATGVVDPSRRTLFIATGNNTSLPTDDISGKRFPTSAQGNNVDTLMALDLDTGDIKWARSTQENDRDVFQRGISRYVPVATNPDGTPVRRADGSIAISPVALAFQVPLKDWDLGGAVTKFSVASPLGGRRDLLGAGSKSGIYYAFDPDSGALVWSTRAGPGGAFGGVQWGAAADGQRIYVAANSQARPWPATGTDNEPGRWVALNAATGAVEWRRDDPLGNIKALATGGILTLKHYRTIIPGRPGWSQVHAPPTVANGVVFTATVDMEFEKTPDGLIRLVNNVPIPIPGKGGHMYALDAANGSILWNFESGASVYGGAAVVDGVVYWGSGYGRYASNPTNVKRDRQGKSILVNGAPVSAGSLGYLYAFEIKQ